MRGPKPRKIYDPEKLKASIARGTKHGLFLYSLGCRCESCRDSKKQAARRTRMNEIAGFTRKDRARKPAKDTQFSVGESLPKLPVGLVQTENRKWGKVC